MGLAVHTSQEATFVLRKNNLWPIFLNFQTAQYYCYHFQYRLNFQLILKLWIMLLPEGIIGLI